MKRLLGFAMMSALLFGSLAACGSGGGSGQASYGGNTVSGSLGLASSALSGRSNALQSGTDAAYEGATVELVDADGNVVAESQVDADGNFNFDNVAQGDYTIKVVDPETGEVVTEVTVSVVDGDDVLIEGVIGSDGADWTVEFTANSADLQNDAQNQKAKDIAMSCGATLDEVLTMREQGMGWGAIANELGVHPGVLGLGAGDGFEKSKKTSADNGKVGPSAKGGGKGNSGGHGNGNNGSNGNGGGKGNGNGNKPGK